MSMLAITMFGATFSGREVALIAAVVIVVVVLAVLMLRRRGGR